MHRVSQLNTTTVKLNIFIYTSFVMMVPVTRLIAAREYGSVATTDQKLGPNHARSVRILTRRRVHHGTISGVTDLVQGSIF